MTDFSSPGGHPAPDHSERVLFSPALATLVLALLFLTGAMHWFYFFHQGNMSFKFHNWNYYCGYYGTLQEAFETRRIPFHIAGSSLLTDRFLAIPVISLSPQVCLLAWLPLGRFVAVNTVLLYSAGFVGCLLLRRKFRLSLIPFAVFFMLFNFNGFISANLGVGHDWVGGYFFLPFFFFFFFDWPAGAVSLRNCAGISLALAAMCLQGSFHVMIWCLLLLLLFALFERAHLRSFAVVMLITSLICSFRLVPGALAYWNSGYPFAYGIPSLRELFDGLTATPYFTYRADVGMLAWMEKDFFVGMVGLAAIAYFGVYLRFSRDARLIPCQYPSLDKPLLVLAVLSLGYFYLLVTLLPLPLIRAERVSARFFILPLVALMLLAAIRMQEAPFILEKSGSRMAWTLVGLALMAFELIDHSYLWRPPYSEAAETIPADFHIALRADPLYIGSVKLFLPVSLLAAMGAVALLVARRARSRQTAQHSAGA